MNISTPGEHNTVQTPAAAKHAHPHFTWANDLLRRAPPSARGHIVAAVGEFAGTIFFLFFAFAGTQVANISSNTNTGTTIQTTVVQKNPAQLLYISLSFGFSLAVNAWVFFRISGGLFNPAVSFSCFCFTDSFSHFAGHFRHVDYRIRHTRPSHPFVCCSMPRCHCSRSIS